MTNADPARNQRLCTIEPLEGRTLFNSPVVSVANVAVRERGSGSVGYALVTVSLERKPSALVKVGYATKAGTATAGSDFAAATGTLKIPAGSRSGTIRIKIIGDDAVEGTEKFYVRLTSALHATLPTPKPIAAVRILDSIPASGPVSNNLSTPFAGIQAVGNNNVLAASFLGTAGNVTLKELTLNIAGFNNGAPLIRVFSDGGAGPLTQIAQFDRVGLMSSTITPTRFVNLLGMKLVPGAKYWVVMFPMSGTTNWAFTHSNSGSGSGFTGEWASSVDGGGHWTVSKNSPLQMQVGAA